MGNFLVCSDKLESHSVADKHMLIIIMQPRVITACYYMQSLHDDAGLVFPCTTRLHLVWASIVQVLYLEHTNTTVQAKIGEW